MRILLFIWEQFIFTPIPLPLTWSTSIQASVSSWDYRVLPRYILHTYRWTCWRSWSKVHLLPYSIFAILFPFIHSFLAYAWVWVYCYLHFYRCCWKVSSLYAPILQSSPRITSMLHFQEYYVSPSPLVVMLDNFQWVVPFSFASFSFRQWKFPYYEVVPRVSCFSLSHAAVQIRSWSHTLPCTASWKRGLPSEYSFQI